MAPPLLMSGAAAAAAAASYPYSFPASRRAHLPRRPPPRPTRLFAAHGSHERPPGNSDGKKDAGGGEEAMEREPELTLSELLFLSGIPLLTLGFLPCVSDRAMDAGDFCWGAVWSAVSVDWSGLVSSAMSVDWSSLVWSKIIKFSLSNSIVSQ